MSARVLLHLPDHVQGRFRAMKIYGIHVAIERLVIRLGGQVAVVSRPDAMTRPGQLPGDGDLHIVENGLAQGPGILNAALAYLEGFYHLDPEGVLADSAIRHRRFDAAEIDEAEAQAFMGRLRARLVGPRRSRYGQTMVRRALPQGAIAVFLQGPKPERLGQAYLTTEAMLETVCRGAGGRTVLVKTHPLQPERGAAQIARAQAAGLPLIQTDANVHDILQAACASVSINSATGFEGLLHGTPAIFCGRSDFDHCVETVRKPADFAPALARALGDGRDLAKAMAWYFGRQCLALDDPGLDAKILARFTEAGFPPERLGLDTLDPGAAGP